MFKDIFYSLTEDEQEMFIKLLAMSTETRKEYSKDYPDGGYFSSRTKPSKPEKTQIQIEKRPEKIVITKTEMFFRNEDFEKQQKQIERKRKKLRKEMEKHFELSAIADYYEQDILDSYTESKVCDEW